MKKFLSVSFLILFLIITGCAADSTDTPVNDGVSPNNNDGDLLQNDNLIVADSDEAKDAENVKNEADVIEKNDTDGSVTPENDPDNTEDDAQTPDIDEGPYYGVPLLFTVKFNGEDPAVLSWKNPDQAGFKSVKVLKNTDAYATSMDDGEVLYEGNGETVSDKNVELGKTYYYTIYALYENNNASKGVNTSGMVCYSNLDIVFVLDVSTSMVGLLSTLQKEIGIVWNAAKEIEAGAQFGMTVFVDDYSPANEWQPYSTVDDITADFYKWYKSTSKNQQTQSEVTNSDYPENTLDALAMTAKNFAWRDLKNTLRVIIHATDDTFLEAPDSFESGIAALHKYDETVQLLKDKTIRVASFAKTDKGHGFFDDYNGMASIPSSTTGEVYDIKQINKTIHMDITINTFIAESLCKSYVGDGKK